MIKSFALLLISTSLLAQATGSLHGRVAGPDGQPLPGVAITLGPGLEFVTNADGVFQAIGIPLNNYRAIARKDGFAPAERLVELRSAVPVRLELTLALETRTAVVEVRDRDDSVAVDPTETGTRAQLSRSEIERLATPAGARGLESILVTFPGFAQNANGAIHPRGAHNQMSFIVDGLPITDQLTGAFANAVDPAIVQTVELFTGNIPAEFGSKVSAVAQVTTRSGLGTGRPVAGSLLLGGAEPFDTAQTLAQAAGERGRLGYSASFNAMQSHRYLDQVSLDNLHNGGHSQRAYTRLDFQATPRDTVRLNVMAGRSAFELANLRSEHALGVDARQSLGDLSAAVNWQRTLNPSTLWETTASWRTSAADLLPGAVTGPSTAWQARRLSTWTLWNRWSAVRGAHNIKAGLDLQHFPLREAFALADPAFTFYERGAGQLYSGFVQDQFRWRRFTFNGGVRFDAYRMLVRGSQPQPRAGVSYQLIEGKTVLRAAYNRLYQTPPNENLLIANSEAAARFFAPILLERGVFRRIRPERQNFYELGLTQALGHGASLALTYYHKQGLDQQDNNALFNTPIVFPTSLASIRVNGAEARLVIPQNRRGLGGTLSVTHARAITTPPFTGGLFIGQDSLALLSAGPFVIDHDQRLSVHGVLQWSHRHGWFATLSTRDDSGLVANPSDPAEVAADPDFADLLPYVNLIDRPARTRPRTVSDVLLGYAHTRAERRVWELSAQLTNLTDTTALYNFQSVFVGTRLVQPRSFGLRWRRFF